MNKSGCIVFNEDKTKVALIYRDYSNDYTFPKGHIENNESLIECAKRETEEEIKIIPIIDESKCFKEEYKSNEGDIVVYYYLSNYGGKSNNTSTDTHEVVWTDIDKVYDKLTYESTKEMWKKVLLIL